jgi:hypothetical protein
MKRACSDKDNKKGRQVQAAQPIAQFIFAQSIDKNTSRRRP